MRLHLDTNNQTTAASGVDKPAQAGAPAGSGGTGSLSTDRNLHDSVAVSSASKAWAASFTDRASRISHLTAAVQNGTYSVSSDAISNAILTSAFAA